MDTSALRECLTEENFTYLTEYAIHYAGLLGKTVEVPEGEIHEQICRLYHHFAGILPEGQELNYELIDGKLRWVVYHVHRWEDHKFYWMPVGFIAELSGAIREITLSFIHLFIRHNGLARFSTCEEYEYLFECSWDSISCNDYEEKEKGALVRLVDSYFNGKISDFLDEVYDYKSPDMADTAYIAHITKLLDEYIPANRQKEALVECFREGLPFISGGCIMAYDYDPHSEAFRDNFDDFPPVALDRMIRYVYDLDDFIANEMEYLMNQYLQETYAATPTSFKILGPDSKLFIPGDYPERFSEWFLKTVNVIIEVSEERKGKTETKKAENE